jgi:purine-nucleoside/S-methyl-5'-thioadenosine phosphorylase / adenosine deaminase
MAVQWITPDWPAPPSVRALSTRRRGGMSAHPYDSLNLGAHVGDVPADVAENRRRLREAAGLPAEPAWLNQVHGTEVAELDRLEAMVAGGPSADAAITRRPGRICAILTADCLPVLFASETGDAVGVAHAGWRGLAAGVLEATVAALRIDPRCLLAWLGPAISAAHFEVGPEVREALLRGDPGAEAAFAANPRGRFMADLPALARSRLTRLGVERIYGGGECTFAQADQYFSHRRDGRTGRQATLIWLEDRGAERSSLGR